MDLLAAIVSGLGLGSMYGLIALGFYVTYAVSGALNFAQGTGVMLGAVTSYVLTVTLGWPPLLALPVVLGVCGLYGAVVEAVAVRPFMRRRSESWLMATVALGLVIDNLVQATFGAEPRSLPSALATSPLMVAGHSAGLYPIQLVIPLVGLGVALILYLVARSTVVGVMVRATAQSRDAARLMGAPVAAITTAVFALSGALAGIAGLLIAPLFHIQSDMGSLFGLKAFAVAILGGVRSAPGVVVAGLGFGLLEALVTAGFGSSYTRIVTFAVVIFALALRPDGLFGGAAVRKA